MTTASPISDLVEVEMPDVGLSETEAARRLGVTVHTLRAWRKRRTPGAPPWRKLGPYRRSRVVYMRSELDTWLEARRRG